MHEFLPRPRFVQRELYNKMGALIERLDNFRDVIEDARHAENYKDFDALMENAYIRARGMCSNLCLNIDELREAGTELHSNEEEDEEDDYDDDEED